MQLSYSRKTFLYPLLTRVLLESCTCVPLLLDGNIRCSVSEVANLEAL